MALNSFLSVKQDTHNPEKVYRLQTEMDDKRCNITIFVDAVTDAYRGQISDEQVKRMSKALNYTEEEYVEECRNALRPDLDDDRFSYQLDGDSFIIRKKVKEKKSMKQIVANIKLERIDFHESFFKIFDEAMKQITDLSTETRSLKTKNESIERNYRKAVQRLNEMEQMKTESDKVLYARFLCLLNSKKAKIAKLEKRLSKSKNDGSEVTGPAVMDYASSDDSVYSVDTDDMETERGEPSPVKLVGEKPSTSKVVCHEPSPMETVYEEPNTPEALRDTPSPSEFRASEQSPMEANYKAHATPSPSKIARNEQSLSESRELIEVPRINPEPSLSEVDPLSGVEQDDLLKTPRSESMCVGTQRISPNSKDLIALSDEHLESDLFDPTVRLKKS